MKLRDIMKLPEFSGFRLVAGAGGQDRDVTATEIIDFEFAVGIDYRREDLFYGNSIGLSSLLFAREEPALILPAVEQLFQMKVSCLAYKPVFFASLPEEVLSFADEHDFPVYEIEDDAFFEDIVLAVKKAVGQDMTETEVERSLEQVLTGELSESEVVRLRQRIAPDLKRYVQAVCFCPRELPAGRSNPAGAAGGGVAAPAVPPAACGNSAAAGDLLELFDREHFVRYARRLALSARYSGRTALCRFRQGGFLLLSREEGSGDLDVLMKDVAVATGMPLKKMRCGLSRVLRTDTEFDVALRQAYWTMRAARIEGESFRHYEDMGIYRLLAPEMAHGTLPKNAEDFLQPLLERGEDEEDRGLLLETAVAYVRAYKNLNEAAERLFCHKNTVRYRINRIHELLAPALSEEDFRECLTLSVLILTLSRDSWEV